MFENRLAALEGAEACRATSTGMSAVFFTLLALLKSGDRIVAARQLFGSCHYIVAELLPKYGIQGEFVDGGDLAQWEKALSKPAQAVLFESPSNPMLDIVDIKAVCDLAHKAGAKVVLDNAFATPMLQRPLEWGADIVVHSATKYIDGQGRTLGGAVLGSKRVHPRQAAADHPQHRPLAQPVQCLGAGQGHGDARPAHRAPLRQCRARGRCAGRPSGDRPRALSRPQGPSAARARHEADVGLPAASSPSTSRPASGRPSRR